MERCDQWGLEKLGTSTLLLPTLTSWYVKATAREPEPRGLGDLRAGFLPTPRLLRELLSVQANLTSAAASGGWGSKGVCASSPPEGGTQCPGTAGCSRPSRTKARGGSPHSGRLCSLARNQVFPTPFPPKGFPISCSSACQGQTRAGGGEEAQTLQHILGETWRSARGGDSPSWERLPAVLTGWRWPLLGGAIHLKHVERCLSTGRRKLAGSSSGLCSPSTQGG
uniref:Uncharacterized protein n=1 Tax=Molossus molossus TaxID=27622 RepID=A0A7J8CYY7_MOLMO|nr:hypothetical protein HJG59_009423 [Molossus molossus]